MRDGEPNIYGALATMRNGYTQMQWTRVQMFLVFNTVALPLVFGTAQSETVKLIISVVAVGIHAILFIATKRADNWIDYMDARMAELERLDAETETEIRVFVFNRPQFGSMRNNPLASRKVFGFFGLLLAATWIWQSISHIHVFFH
jgi:hypothetical protein